MNNWVLSLRSIVNGENPSTDISNILYEHDCLYLLSKLDNNELVKKLRIEKNLVSYWAKIYYTQCKLVFKQLNESNIPYAVIKGIVLSEMAYKNPFFRKFSDLDLLISREFINDIKSILYSEGFMQGRIVDNNVSLFSREELIYQAANTHQLAPFVKPTGDIFCPFVTVDVNYDIMWGESERNLNTELILEQVEPIELFGVKILTLNKEMGFISLCLHHYKDMNSIYLLWEGKAKISLFSDIFYYLKNNDLNLKKMKELAEMLSVSKYIYYCLFFSYKLFSDSFFLPYLHMFYSKEATLLLNTYGLSESERKEWRLDFFDRLFPNNVKEYFGKYLTDDEKEKIRLNNLYM